MYHIAYLIPLEYMFPISKQSVKPFNLEIGEHRDIESQNHLPTNKTANFYVRVLSWNSMDIEKLIGYNLALVLKKLKEYCIIGFNLFTLYQSEMKLLFWYTYVLSIVCISIVSNDVQIHLVCLSVCFFPSRLNSLPIYNIYI